MPTETPTETEVDVDTATPVERGDGPLARPPELTGEDVSRPTGEPGNLRVLDWAGFESAVTYSFDDSQPSHLSHYDALESTGVNTTFYLSKNVTAGSTTGQWTDVAADGHEIGNHTVSHPHNDLTGSSFGDPLDSMDAEISQCSEYITGELGQEGVWTMASPFGESGWTQAARSNGLFLNRGVGGGAVAPGPGADPYNLPCYMAEEGDTADTFNGLVDEARSNGEWLVFLFHSITPTDQEWFAPVGVDEIIGSVEHAKSYDDVWIDTVANVGAYWRGQQLFESVTPNESGDRTVWEWELPDAFPEGQHLRDRGRRRPRTGRRDAGLAHEGVLRGVPRRGVADAAPLGVERPRRRRPGSLNDPIASRSSPAGWRYC